MLFLIVFSKSLRFMLFEFLATVSEKILLGILQRVHELSF